MVSVLIVDNPRVVPLIGHIVNLYGVSIEVVVVHLVHTDNLPVVSAGSGDNIIASSDAVLDKIKATSSNNDVVDTQLGGVVENVLNGFVDAFRSDFPLLVDVEFHLNLPQVADFPLSFTLQIYYTIF